MSEPNFPCPKCKSTDLQAGTSTYEFSQTPMGAAGQGAGRELLAATQNFICRACRYQFAVRHQYTDPKR